ncbi:MAG: GDP-mannose 4,6-dehydratase, partial [Candidatus Omnitrophota bacterium]
MSVVLVSGSCGLIGSEAVTFFAEKGFDIVGIDNNMRKIFFGDDGSTLWNRRCLRKLHKNYKHFSADIRSTRSVESIFKKYGKNIQLIIHAAAQPSHDWAAKDPLTDFGVNALGTVILLEAFRKYSPQAAFIF